MPRQLPWQQAETEFLAGLPRPPTTPGRLRGKLCLNRIPNLAYRFIVDGCARGLAQTLHEFPLYPTAAPTEVIRDYLDLPEGLPGTKGLKVVQGAADRNGYVSVWLDTYLGMLAVGHYRVDPAE